MARTVRNRPVTKEQSARDKKRNLYKNSDGKVFHVALYVRLSVEDGGKDNSNTVENQLVLLKDYVSDKPHFKVYSTYIDNGSTGTNFERPEFNRMLSDMKQGKINCIIVKDLSRFGRNYLETGNYIEKIFPFFQVRFIAITDNFDTETADKTEEGTIVPLKNLINDVYAKDISRKISSSIEAKIQKGEYGGGLPPFGYLKSKDQKGKYLIDKEAAEIVKQIFEMRAEGYGYHSIVRTLNEQGIESPTAYRYRMGMIKKAGAEKVLWKRYAIEDLLRDQVYLGYMVRGKTKSALYKGEKRHKLPESEWIIIKGTHEPIISQALFDKANEVTKDRKEKHLSNIGKYDYLGGEENILRGKIFCGDCGITLVMSKSIVNKNKVKYSYICPNYKENRERICKRKGINKKDLEEAVLHSLGMQIDLFADMKQKALQKEMDESCVNERKLVEKEILHIEAQIKKTESLESNLYVDFKEELLTESEYIYAKKKYKTELEEQMHKLDVCKSKILQFPTEFLKESKCNQTLLQIPVKDKLTKQIVDAFIEKILVYQDNRIEIRWNFRDEFEKMYVICNGKMYENLICKEA